MGHGPKTIGKDEAFALFKALSLDDQLAIMMARNRLTKCNACPQHWTLDKKIAVADLTAGIAA